MTAAVRFRARLVIMCKAPVMGRVKTRLGREIGLPQATQIYRSTLSHVAARLSRSGRWQTILAVAPDVAVASPMLPQHLERVPQGAGDLGQKLQNVVDSLPPGPVVIIGTDIPGIRARDIAAAFDKLGSHDAVFGPASDGGYWLVGFRRRPATPRAFHGVRWSGPHALSDTKKNLSGHSVAEIATLDDTDTADDLARLSRFIGRRILPA